jgi:protein phosphatase
VLSSDFCRALVSDDEADQSATNEAFELLHFILAKRLRRRRTTVIDATNVEAASRERLAAAAKQNDIPLVGIVFALPEEVCQARNRQRTYRQVPAEIIQKQVATLVGSLHYLSAEGFLSVFPLRSAEELDNTVVVRVV